MVKLEFIDYFPKATFAVVVGIFLLSRCTNDNLVSLTPKKVADTTSAAANSVPSNASSGTLPSGNPPASSSPPPNASVSFSRDVKPILDKYQCASCHGTYYSTYPGATSLANSGYLYGTMSWSAGYRRMPPGQKASSTELSTIKTWISEGTPNN